MKQILSILLTCTLLASCTSQQTVSYGQCDTDATVTASNSKFIAFEHKNSNFDLVSKEASSWCQKENKKAVMEQHECHQCCRTAFQCRQMTISTP